MIISGLFTPNFYIVNYAVSRNFSPTTAFYVLSALNASSIIGRILPAALSDAFGRFNLIVPCLFLTGLSTLALWSFANTLELLIFYAIVYGFFSGAFNALIVPCIAQISDIREIGMRIGMLYSILSFS
jgi:MFS family permease